MAEEDRRKALDLLLNEIQKSLESITKDVVCLQGKIAHLGHEKTSELISRLRRQEIARYIILERITSGEVQTKTLWDKLREEE